MKLSAHFHQRGSVLMTTLIIAVLVGIVAGALLVVAQQQNYLTARSQTWCSEIPIAEAGVEEAMAHLNSKTTNWAVNGWSIVGSNCVKTRTLDNDYFYTVISTSSPPTITAIGYGRVPLSTNYTQRTLFVTTKRNFAGGGVIAKGKIAMSGGSFIDSFDPTDPLLSSNGLYTISRRSDRALVASTSSLKPAVDSGTGKIYGNAATGVGGTVAGNIGDGSYLLSNTGVQSGHSSDDFNMAIPDASVPGDFSGLPIPAANGLGQYVLTGGDYTAGTFTIPGGKSMIIMGPGRVRIYFTGDFTTSGSGLIRINAGASLELYLGGKGTISGGGVVNGSQNAVNCAIYGLPTCTSMTYSGSAQYIGTVYTPQADFTFSGGQGASGSFVANTMSLSGSAGVHYDESLGRPSAPYSITSWAEL